MAIRLCYKTSAIEMLGNLKREVETWSKEIGEVDFEITEKVSKYQYNEQYL